MVSMSIGKCVAHWSRLKSDQLAVTDATSSLNWAALEQTTNRSARLFRKLGVKAGDYVVIALPNGIEFVQSAVAVWKLGAIPLPLSCKTPPEERHALLSLVAPSLILGIEEEGFASLAAGYVPDSGLPDLPLDDVISPNWKALASGGSTGRPKIIVSTEPGAFDPDELPFGIDRDGTYLVAGPLYHNASFLFAFRSLFAGSRLVILPRFDPEAALAAIDRDAVTYTVMVPTMMQRIAKLPKASRERYNISTLKTLLHTGAPCPSWLKKRWIDWLGGDGVQEVFGVTEGIGSWVSGTEWLERPGTAGRPLPGTQVRITGPDGQALPPYEIGDIYWMPANGAGSTYFYHGATSQRDADGWEWFGDMGHIDDDGFIYLADRRTDLIISGGANVYPAEVEAAIDAFPGVRTNAVIGLPDDDLGARVHAIVDAPDPVDEQALRAHLARHLTSYKLPRSIEFVDEPLRDETGKVRRGALREQRLSPLVNAG